MARKSALLSNCVSCCPYPFCLMSSRCRAGGGLFVRLMVDICRSNPGGPSKNFLVLCTVANLALSAIMYVNLSRMCNGVVMIEKGGRLSVHIVKFLSMTAPCIASESISSPIGPLALGCMYHFPLLLASNGIG